MTTDKPSIIKELNKANSYKKIKIRARKKTDGSFSVYLDIFVNNARSYDYLGLVLIGKPGTLIVDKNTLKLAIEIRDRKELELLEKKTGFILTDKSDVEFLAYFIKATRNSLWTCTINMFKKFIKKDRISFSEITPEFCSQFAKFLTEQVSVNSAYTYFTKFIAVLNQAKAEKIITKNPSLGIRFKTKQADRQYLSEEEILSLINTPKTNEIACNAFLFAIFTGLRSSDIRQLTYDQIFVEQGNTYILFKQQKTNNTTKLKISENAIEIINFQKEKYPSDFIFPLPSKTSVNKYIGRWAENAGIKKYVTFHCGRHTFATRCLTFDIDLFTISKLLGHWDMATTKIYAKLIDKKKDEAIDKLPTIKL